MARQKGGDRGIEIELAAADAFHLERLGRRFETVPDCGLFHTFDGDERPRYVASLASVTEHDGTLHVLCFSDDGPDTGPVSDPVPSLVTHSREIVNTCGSPCHATRASPPDSSGRSTSLR